MRDFVCVRDVVSLMVNNGEPSGVYDLGTSHPISFQMVAELVSAKYGADKGKFLSPKTWMVNIRSSPQTRRISNISSSL